MDPLSWLYARQGRFAPGLERIRALLARLGHPEEAYPVALVGGSEREGHHRPDPRRHPGGGGV